jgi:hypothetical protein
MKKREKLQHSEVEQTIPTRMAKNWNRGSPTALQSETVGIMLKERQ